MARDIVLVSFDFPKSDYDYRSYAISSILASLKKFGISASHYFIDIHQVSEERLLNGDFMQSDSDIEKLMHSKIDSILEYLEKFQFIAIAAARWSKDYVKYLVKKLREIKYKGKIICGSYEVTATNKYMDLLENFGDADYFIKGYAEKPLIKIIKEKDVDYVLSRVIDGDLDSKYLASPYQEGIIPLYSRKIYWETKRGCKFSCGFCEWGNRKHKDAIEIDEGILKKDIELFSNSNIEEINILDGTFNIGESYLNYLQELLEKTDCRITFQARFEITKNEFLDLCEKYKERVHLEFGLQTIHKNEMLQIGRKNNMEKVERCMSELNQRHISYEVSLIYAIPGQTVDSFIDSIEFLKINGCKRIRAYPLQIPNNYDKEKKINVGELQLDKYKIESVANSYSFTKFDRWCMDIIAGHLNEVSELKTVIGTIGKNKWKSTETAYEVDEYIRNDCYKKCSKEDLDSAKKRLNLEKTQIDIDWIVNCWQKDKRFAECVIALIMNGKFCYSDSNPNLNEFSLNNKLVNEYKLYEYWEFWWLMKKFEFHQKNNKASLCNGLEYVYKIDDDILTEYERYYIDLFISDYVNLYNIEDSKVKKLDFEFTQIDRNPNDNKDYYAGMFIPALFLHKHIENYIEDIDNKLIRLSPVIRIGESGDFYVYANARYFIGKDECSFDIFRFLTLKKWEELKEKIPQDKYKFIKIWHPKENE